VKRIDVSAEGGSLCVGSVAGDWAMIRSMAAITGGVGAAKTQAAGEAYNLHNISGSKGLYTQSSGGPGLVKSGASDLWLRNAAARPQNAR
jgi:hypothetical protein